MIYTVLVTPKMLPIPNHIKVEEVGQKGSADILNMDGVKTGEVHGTAMQLSMNSKDFRDWITARGCLDEVFISRSSFEAPVWNIVVFI